MATFNFKCRCFQ